MEPTETEHKINRFNKCADIRSRNKEIKDIQNWGKENLRYKKKWQAKKMINLSW